MEDNKEEIGVLSDDLLSAIYEECNHTLSAMKQVLTAVGDFRAL